MMYLGIVNSDGDMQAVKHFLPNLCVADVVA
jgi:hypothetical protein